MTPSRRKPLDGVSKAALIRWAVDKEFRAEAPRKDGWEALLGWLDTGEPIDDIDEVLYGRAK
jgi:hypothetical protein